MEAISLNSTVILGYADVAAAGSRTLFGISRDHFTSHKFSLSCFDSKSSAAVTDEDGSLDAAKQFLVYNPTSKESKISIVIVNTVVPQELCHVAASELIDFLIDRKTAELVLLSAFPNVDSKSSYSKISNIGDQKCVGQTSSIKSKDGFFNSLIQFALIENLSVTTVLVEGRKSKKRSTPNDIDGSKLCIENLHKYLKNETNLPMNIERSLSMIYSGETYNDDDVALMYN